MQVPINEEFFIETDERSFVLKRMVKRQARDGSGYNEYPEYCYYPTIEQLCEQFIQKNIKTFNCSEVQDIVDAINVSKEEILDVLKTMPFENLVRHVDIVRKGGISELEVPIKAKRGRKPGTKNKEKK